jgi:hypothetical protein
MLPQSSFCLPAFKLWYHNLHSTYYFASYGATIFIQLTTPSIMVPQSLFHSPLPQLWCHNIHSTYHFVNYGATIFISLTTSSVMVPQYSFNLPLRQLWCHNIHSTYHFVSYGATIFISLTTSSVMVPQYSFHLPLIFCPCTSFFFVMQHFSFLVQRITVHYSDVKETGRRECKFYNDTRIFFFASGIHRCSKIFAHPTLLCYVQQCVIFVAAKWRCRRIIVQIGNSSKCWQRISQRVAAGRVRDIGQNVSQPLHMSSPRTGLAEFRRVNHLPIAKEVAKICHGKSAFIIDGIERLTLNVLFFVNWCWLFF